MGWQSKIRLGIAHHPTYSPAIPLPLTPYHFLECPSESQSRVGCAYPIALSFYIDRQTNLY